MHNTFILVVMVELVILFNETRSRGVNRGLDRWYIMAHGCETVSHVRQRDFVYNVREVPYLLTSFFEIRDSFTFD